MYIHITLENGQTHVLYMCIYTYTTEIYVCRYININIYIKRKHVNGVKPRQRTASREIKRNRGEIFQRLTFHIVMP